MEDYSNGHYLSKGIYALVLDRKKEGRKLVASNPRQSRFHMTYFGVSHLKPTLPGEEIF